MADRQRLPLRSIGAVLLAELPSSGGLIVALVVSSAEPIAWAGPWLRPALLFLLTVRVLHPLHVWVSTLVCIERDGLKVGTGLLIRRVRTVTWRDVVAIDIRSTWSDRLLGLQCVTVAGAGDSEIVLAGIDRLRAEEIAAAVRGDESPVKAGISPNESPLGVAQSETVREPSTTLHSVAPDRSRVLFRMSTSDLLLAGLAQGKLFVLTLLCAGTVVSAMDRFGLLPEVLILFQEVPAAASALLVLLSALGAGGVLLVRFHAFEMVDRDGVLVIRFGLIGRAEREVLSASVIGLRMRRNPVEMALDRVRIDVMSADSAGRSTSRVVLPSLPRAALPAVLVEGLSSNSSTTLLSSDGRDSLPRAIRSSVVVVLSPALCLLTWSMFPAWVVLLLVATAFLLTLSLARLLTATLTVESGLLIRRVRSVGDQDEVVLASALHLVNAVAPAISAPHLVRAHYLAGRSRALTVLTSSSELEADLGDAICAAAPCVAARRRRIHGGGQSR